jgi:apolipoprotein N-acyltransferase
MDAWRSIFPLGGFEWGAIAYAHVDGSWMLPVARILGGRGLTLLTVLISVAAVEVVRTTVTSVRTAATPPIDRALRSSNVPVGLLVGGLLLSVVVTIEPPAGGRLLDVLSVQGNDIRHWISRVDDPSFRIRARCATRRWPPSGTGRHRT